MMFDYFVAVLGLSAVCILWVLVQRWHARGCPGSPGGDVTCGACEHPCPESNSPSEAGQRPASMEE
jgi:hypothetical protein